MKVSLSWLRDIAPGLDASPSELAEQLASRGFPVEEIRPLGAGLDEIVAARVHSVRPHPNADRLTLCEVDGGDGMVQVVCGAPNVRAGGWYPFAPVGAALPGGMRIKQAKLRGEMSEGMLCSERELGLGPGQEGLMALPEAATPGLPLAEVLGLDDVRMDVEVTSNRPDLLSHEGVARELAPQGHRSLELPDFPLAAPGAEAAAASGIERLEHQEAPREASGDGITVRIEDPELCSRYLGLVVRGVRVGPSPPWLQSRLRSVGARPINNVVDATNYVLLELGQPLHAFDLDRIRDRTVIVRRAREGETIRTLDGEIRTLTPEMLGICDTESPLAVAGVMGGEESEVTEGTSDLLLECALFTPGPIRSTRKALGLSTESSYRFERGVDPEGMERALLRAARLILATAGGTVSGPIVDCRPRAFSRRRISFRPERAERVLGIPFSGPEIRALLEPLGFPVADDGGALSVEVPGFRSYDVTREVDLIEEVARRHGFDRFPDTLGPFRPGTVPDHPLFSLEDRLRSELAAWGLLEAQTPAFAPAPEGDIEILNPISTEEGFLRSRLLPGLVRRLEYNAARGNRDVRLFELGTVFSRGEPGGLPRESTHLAAILHGRSRPPHWSGEDVPLDLWDLKGLLEHLVTLVPGEGWELAPARAEEASPDPFEAGAGFAILDPQGTAVGTGGRLHPGEADLPRWAGEVFALELTLPPVPSPASELTYRPLPLHPGVDRDLALLLPRGTQVARVLAVVKERGGEWLREVRVFDVYHGKEVGGDVRSVAIRLHFRAPDRTLRDEEVDDAARRVLGALQEELGVGFRGQKS